MRVRGPLRPSGELTSREAKVLYLLAETHREYQDAENFTGSAVAAYLGEPVAGTLGSLVEYGYVLRRETPGRDEGFGYSLTPAGVAKCEGLRRAVEGARLALADGRPVLPRARASTEHRERLAEGGPGSAPTRE